MTHIELLKIIKNFKEKKGAEYGILGIGIFGSVARGEDTEKSDVDVVVELTEPDIFRLIGIKQDLEEQLQRHVDIVRYRDKMNTFLKRRINKEAIYV